MPAELDRLPGHDLVRRGVADLAAGARSEEALLVGLAADRLRGAGVQVPAVEVERPAHALYHLLYESHGNAAHSRYNALLRRIVSFARAAEHANGR